MKSTFFVILGLVLVLVFAGGCASMQVASNQPSGINGQVLAKGKPAEGVYVYAYTSPVNDLRLPTKLISAPTSAEGRYTLDLAPGNYYIVARRRTDGSRTGYLGLGDFEGKYPSNPVVVSAGRYTPVNLSVSMLPGKFLLAPYTKRKGELGISGRVLTKGGEPVADAFVMVYTRKDRIGRPAYLSQPTNERGEYVVYLKNPGTYYVSARDKYGDLPRKGDAYGTYDDNPDHMVELNEKTLLTGIDVTMVKFTRDLTKAAEH